MNPDSLILVTQINRGSTYKSSVGLIIDDCRTLILSLNGCSIVHVLRSANQITHCLAKAYVSRSEMGEWGYSPPRFLNDVLAQYLIQ